MVRFIDNQCIRLVVQMLLELLFGYHLCTADISPFF